MNATETRGELVNRFASDGDPSSDTRPRRRSPYRPVDGFVVGRPEADGDTRDIWVLVSRPGEGLMDFFLEDDPIGVAADPGPRCCLGIEDDGTLRIGTLDWETDRFLSELMEEKAAEALL